MIVRRLHAALTAPIAGGALLAAALTAGPAAAAGHAEKTRHAHRAGRFSAAELAAWGRLAACVRGDGYQVRRQTEAGNHDLNLLVSAPHARFGAARRQLVDHEFAVVVLTPSLRAAQTVALLDMSEAIWHSVTTVGSVGVAQTRQVATQINTFPAYHRVVVCAQRSFPGPVRHFR